MELSALKLELTGVDAKLAEMVSLGVRFRWPEAAVLTAEDQGGAIALVAHENPDIVVLQPRTRGLPLTTIIPEIRRFSDVPILVLGQTGEEVEAIKALELGADDYAGPGTGYMEITARIVSILRRFRGHAAFNGRDVFTIGPLTMNSATYRASIGDTALNLTATEFRLLLILARNRGTVLSHEVLARAIWDGHVESGALLKKYVQRLRRKLGDDPREPRWIVSVHGVGYRFIGASMDQPAPVSD